MEEKIQKNNTLISVLLVGAIAVVEYGCGSAPAGDERCDLRHGFYDRVGAIKELREVPPGMEVLVYRASVSATCRDFVLNRSGGLDLTMTATTPSESTFLLAIQIGAARNVVFDDRNAPGVRGSLRYIKSYEGRTGAFQLPWSDSPEHGTVYFAIPKDLEPSLYPSGVTVRLDANEKTI